MKVKRLTTGCGKLLAAITAGLLVTHASWAAPKYKVLHAFGGNDGAGLWTSVTLDQEGRLYGATSGGGLHGQGVVFKLTPHSNGSWAETILHSFPASSHDGGDPNGGLIQDRAGNWYGTTVGGGYHNTGTVFKLTHRSDGWVELPLYKFGTSNADDGYGPTAGLVMDKAGNLYGAAPRGGPTLGGAVFELTPRPSGWQETLVDTFSQKNDGGGPFAGVILDSAGNLYGTTEGGGAYDVGTVYEVEHTTTGWHEKVLHSFDNNGKDGVEPGVGALFIDSSGSLYGTTLGGGSHTCFASEIGAFTNGLWAGHFPRNAIGNCGTIFKLTKLADGRWKETILYNFQGGATGSGPGGGVVMDKAGNLYGTTIYGGSGCGCGVVYKLAPNAKGKWTYTVLHTFVGADGAQPDANLIVDDKGNLYGTTATGGTYGGGVVFEITP